MLEIIFKNVQYWSGHLVGVGKITAAQSDKFERKKTLVIRKI
jgi:hypothetical protein